MVGIFKGICECGNNQESRGRSKKTGKTIYRHLCTSCRKKKHKNIVRDKCASCGFVPADPCQMDIDHIDGNRNNNNKENLQVLCANCHRLKTKIQKDWKNNYIS